MEKLDFVRKINICLRIGPKQIATFLCSSGWLNTANRHLISFHGKHIWQCPHWYGFSLVWILTWFSCKTFAKLTVQWFLFGMGSYKMWYSLCNLWIKSTFFFPYCVACINFFRKFWFCNIIMYDTKCEKSEWYGFSLVWVLILSLRPSILPWKAHLAMLTLIWFLFGMSPGGYSTLSWVRMCGPKFRPPPYNKTREDANLLPI